MVDPKVIADYIEGGGPFCPVCLGYNTNSDGRVFSSKYMYNYWLCHDCKATWTETYTLTGVTVDEGEN